MDKDRIDQIIDKHYGEPRSPMKILLDIQAENNGLSRKALEGVAERLQVPLTRIQHIAGSYKAFSLVPKGRHQIHICVGTACHLRGTSRVLDTVAGLTGSKPASRKRSFMNPKSPSTRAGGGVVESFPFGDSVKPQHMDQERKMFNGRYGFDDAHLGQRYGGD